MAPARRALSRLVPFERRSRMTGEWGSGRFHRRAMARMVALAATAVGCSTLAAAAEVWDLTDPVYTWANPLAWGHLSGEPYDGSSVAVRTSIGIEYAPLLHPTATFDTILVAHWDLASTWSSFFSIANRPALDAPGFFVDRGAGMFGPVLSLPASPQRVLRAGTMRIGDADPNAQNPTGSTSGALLISGGEVRTTGTIQVGSALFSAGYVRLHDGGFGGPTLAVGQNLVLGEHGGGAFFQQDAGLTAIGGSLLLGRDAQSSQTGLSFLNLAAGSMSVGFDSVIGNGASPWQSEVTRNEGAFRHGAASHVVGRDLIVGRDGGIGHYETMAGAVVQVGRNLLIGQSGTGTFVHGGGTIDVLGSVSVGVGSNGSGRLDVHGNASLNVGSDLLISGRRDPNGNRGDVDVDSTGTLAVGGKLILGEGPVGGNLRLIRSGGASFASNAYIGASGFGRLEQSEGGGLVKFEADVVLGDRPDGRGEWALGPGARAQIAGMLTVGKEGTATLTGGTLTVAGRVVAGALGTFAQLHANDGLWTFQRDLILGERGDASLRISGTGQVTVIGSIVAGQLSPASSGAMLLESGMLSIGGHLKLGSAGQGALRLVPASDGNPRVGVAGDVILGEFLDVVTVSTGAGSTTTVNQQGTGVISIGDDAASVGHIGDGLTIGGRLVLGLENQGTLRAADGITRVGGDVLMAMAPEARGTMLLRDDARFHAAGAMTVGGGGIATVTLSGQELSVAGLLGIGLAATGGGTVNVTAGSLLAGALTVGPTGSLSVTGGRLATDVVRVGATGTALITGSLGVGTTSADHAATSLTLNGSATFQGEVLRLGVGGLVAVNESSIATLTRIESNGGELTQTGGTTTVTTHVEIGPGAVFTLRGGTFASGTLGVTNSGLGSTLSLTLGAPSSSTPVPWGTLIIDGGRLETGLIKNAGRLEWRVGDLTGTELLHNESGGLLLALSDGRLVRPLDSRGTVRKDGPNETSFMASFAHGGALHVDAGKLSLRGGIGGTGTTTVAAGATLALSGSAPFVFGGRFDNAGITTLTDTQSSFGGPGEHNGGRFEIDGPSLLELAGVAWRFAGAGTGFFGSGRLTISSGSVDFDAGSTLASNGPLGLLGGSLRFNAGSNFPLPQTFAIRGTDVILSTGAGHVYGRDITLTAGGLGGSDAFTHTAGRFDWTGGSLHGDGMLVLESPVGLAISGAAEKQLDRTLRVHGSAEWSGGNIRGSGALELANGAAFTGTTAGSFAPRVETRGTFLSQVAAGTATYFGRFDAIGIGITVDRGAMRLAGGGSSDAPFDVRANASVEFDGLATQFVFDGSAARLSGAGTAGFFGGRTLFRNGATFGGLAAERIAGGTLELGPGGRYAFNPSLVLEAGGLTVSTGLGAFTMPASMTVQSGILDGTDERIVPSGGSMKWLGGTIAGTGVTRVNNGALMRISGPDSKALDGALVNHGSLRWDGGNVGGAGSIENASTATATFEVLTGGILAPAVTNRSILTVDNGGVATTFQGRLRNDHLLSVDSGVLRLTGAFDNLVGGTLTGGDYRVTGALQHSGANITTLAAHVGLFGSSASFRTASGVELLDTFTSITAGAALSIQNGKNYALADGRTITIDGLFTVGNGSQFNAMSGNVAGSGMVHLKQGSMTWSMADLSGAGSTLQVDAGGALVIENLGSNHDHFGRALINRGAVRWTSGDVRGGTLGGVASRLLNEGVWQDENASTQNVWNFTGGTVLTFENSGTYLKSGAGTTRFMSQRMQNTGRIELNAGGLEFWMGGSSSGVIDIAAGRTLRLTGGEFAFNDGSRVTGAGIARLEAGTATMNGSMSFSNLVLASGTVTGTHTVDGQVRWQRANLNANGTTTLAPGATLILEDAGSNHDHFGRALINRGTVRWTSGDVRGGTLGGVASRLVNEGVWQDENASTQSIWNFTDQTVLTFENAGTYVKSGAGTTRFMSQRMQNTGRIELNAGGLEFWIGGSNSSVIDIAAGRTLRLVGGDFAFTDGSRVTGPGVIRMEVGTAAMSGAVSFSNLVLASGAAIGTHKIDGQVRWQQANFNALGTTIIAAGSTLSIEGSTSNHEHLGRTLRNEGTTYWRSGDLWGGAIGVTPSRIENAGVWRDEAITSQNTANRTSGAPLVFENTGTYFKTLAPGAVTPTQSNFFGYRMDNGGTVEVAAGTLNFDAGVAQVVGNRLTGGTWIVGPGALILIPGISPLNINEGSVHLRGQNSRMSGISTLADNRGEFRISEGRNFTALANLASSGVLAVGAGSTLVTTGNVVLASGGTFEIDIEGPGAGDGHGTLAASGNASLAGRLKVDLNVATPNLAATTFTLLTAVSVQGEFAGLPDGARFDAGGIGGSFVIDYTPTAVYLNSYVAAVPEPGAWVLMGLGALLVGGKLRRTRAPS